MTQYHIVLDETLTQADLLNGLYKDTMLGFSYQLAIFHNDSNVGQALISSVNVKAKSNTHTLYIYKHTPYLSLLSCV